MWDSHIQLLLKTLDAKKDRIPRTLLRLDLSDLQAVHKQSTLFHVLYTQSRDLMRVE